VEQTTRAGRERWVPLPDDAPYDRREGAFLVDGSPVNTMLTPSGYKYLLVEP